jgi:hypothetical protein
MFTAWVDESGSDGKADPDTYLLAAAICEVATAELARASLRSLLSPGQRKLHWRDESDKRRRQIVEHLAGMHLEHVVVVRNGMPGERFERRRRKCLNRLLVELDGMAVDHVVLESRGAADDRRDRKVLEYLRQNHALQGKVHMDHAKGPSDPLLWAPDTVCGAVTQHRVGNLGYLELLAAKVEIITLDVTDE